MEFIFKPMYLYNTLSKTKEKFISQKDKEVLMYSCGPTVYNYAHIGNLRTYLSVDFLRRTLEYLGYKVKQVKNITDVGHLTQDDIDEGQDKIELRAKEKNLSPEQIARYYEKAFKADEKKLNIEASEVYPRATEYVEKMIEAIKTLIKEGVAYEKNGAVFFDITKAHSYGKLSGNTLKKLEAGIRICPSSTKKNPFDFYLWRPAEKNHLMKWSSPWGIGYPGWHIECSVMNKDCLKNNVIDIHTGGEDNIFPHHENEIAQSQILNNVENPVRFWFHPRHLVVNGNKMAKSKNNFYTLKNLENKGYKPLAFRLLVFQSHYRSPLDFSFKALDQANKNLRTIRGFVRRLEDAKKTKVIRTLTSKIPLKIYENNFIQAISNDIDTPEALSVIFALIKESNKLLDKNKLGLKDIEKIIKLITKFDKVLMLNLKSDVKITIPEKIKRLAKKRLELKKEKKYEEADKIREEMKKKGYVIKDKKTGFSILKK